MRDAYNAGEEAARTGAEIWENPHCKPTDSPNDFNHWLAGWCLGKQFQALKSEDNDSPRTK